MSKPAWLDQDEMAAWRTFLHASARILDRLDSELQAAHGLTLGDYEIISNLSESDDDRMRMTQLATVAHVSKSRLTYRVDRLEERGLVKRSADGPDRRAVYAVLTSAGRELLNEAAPTHLETVRRHLIDRLTPTQRQGLTESLRCALNSIDV